LTWHFEFSRQKTDILRFRNTSIDRTLLHIHFVYASDDHLYDHLFAWMEPWHVSNFLREYYFERWWIGSESNPRSILVCCQNIILLERFYDVEYLYDVEWLFI